VNERPAANVFSRIKEGGVAGKGKGDFAGEEGEEQCFPLRGGKGNQLFVKLVMAPCFSGWVKASRARTSRGGDGQTKKREAL